MKKLLFLMVILVYMGAGCTQCDCDKKTEPIPPVDWTRYKSATQEDVAAMAKHYVELVAKDPKIGIQQINMDGALLQALMFGTEGLKLIATADLRTNAVTVYLQFWRRGVFTYYDINSFFNSGEPGMRGQPPLCPPPAGCDLPFPRSTNPEVLSESDVTKMEAHYNEVVAADPALAIQQVNMDGLILYLLLYKTEGFKLIAAADLTTNEVTVVVQFWRGGEFTYYDIRDLFTPDMRGMRGKAALCPPPPACDIP